MPVFVPRASHAVCGGFRGRRAAATCLVGAAGSVTFLHAVARPETVHPSRRMFRVARTSCCWMSSKWPDSSQEYELHATHYGIFACLRQRHAPQAENRCPGRLTTKTRTGRRACNCCGAIRVVRQQRVTTRPEHTSAPSLAVALRAWANKRASGTDPAPVAESRRQLSRTPASVAKMSALAVWMLERHLQATRSPRVPSQKGR